LIVGAGKRVLVLEDEPIIGFALEDMLLSLGFDIVDIATRLEDATQAIAAADFDAAVLDVNIHGQRSYPIADALAERDIFYIFATGYGDTEHPLQHRTTPTVTKPYSIDDLRGALRPVL
jgi:DNA-binding response OmpR family regulator